MSGFDNDDFVVDTPQNEEDEVVEQALVKPSTSSSISLGYGDELAGRGIVIGEVGIKVTRYPIDKIRLTTQKKERVAILVNQVLIIKTHYNERIGTFRCFEGKCCDYEEVAKPKLIFPVVQYETDLKGKIITPNVELKVLPMTIGTYEDLITLQEQLDRPITDFDFILSCKEEQYQNYTIQQVGEANWKKSPRLVNEITEKWKAVRKYVTLSVARDITEEYYLKQINADTGATVPDVDIDFSKAFGD